MKTRLRFAASVLCASALAATAACGSLDGNTGNRTTLATVHGQLTNPQSLSIASSVRVAVVWMSNTGYNVAEDLPIQPEFPSRFVLQLDQPPPAAAMITQKDWSFQAAYGFVVAYEDVNGNGKLDLVEGDAGAFLDKIVGANTTMAVAYLQGTIPTSGTNLADSSGRLPTLGYNLSVASQCQVTPQDAGSSCAGFQWFGMDQAYDLQISSDPEVNQLMCATYGKGSSSSGESGPTWYVDQMGSPPGGYPAAGASGLTCTSATSYSVSNCTVVHNGLCQEATNCSTVNVSLGAAPKPSGWPCP